MIIVVRGVSLVMGHAVPTLQCHPAAQRLTIRGLSLFRRMHAADRSTMTRLAKAVFFGDCCSQYGYDVFSLLCLTIY